MSGLEVVAAVAAVTSAIHGGSELLKLFREKRRARKVRDSDQQKSEENQLEKLLADGEKQINLRYKQYEEELGDYVRIGDEIARDQLIRIASMLRGITHNLRLSATHENDVPRLHLLYQASITTREDTIVTLDELKLRIYIAKPISPQLLRAVEPPRRRDPRAPVKTIPMNNHNPNEYLQKFTPPASQADLRSTRPIPTDYWGSNGSQGLPAVSAPAYASAQTRDPNFTAALESLRPEVHAAFMRDFESLMISYRGLSLSERTDEIRNHGQRIVNDPVRRDTLVMPQGQDSHEYDRTRPDRDERRVSEQTHQASVESNLGNDIERPPFQQQAVDVQPGQSSFDQQHPGYTTPTTHLQVHAGIPRPRWSDASTSSSVSGTWSLDRDSSSSSQGSTPQSRSTPAGPTLHEDHSRFIPKPSSSNTSHQYSNGDSCSPRPSSDPYVPLEDFYKPSPLRMVSQPRPSTIADADTWQTHNSNTNPPVHMAWPVSGHNRDSPFNLQYAPMQHSFRLITQQASDTSNPTSLQYGVSSPVVDSISNMRNNNSEYVTPRSALAAFATSTLASASTTERPRHTSLTDSIASTDSSASAHISALPIHRKRISIRTDTIQGGTADGSRPDKSNGYWGFCKGAWDVRDKLKKGMEVRLQPSGYYNNKRVWTCKSCMFTGSVFTLRHSTKKSKMDDFPDPHIKVSESGIRYRWIFLAKSHVKKKAGAPGSVDDNFGCIFCNAENNVSGVYGGVESLMNHIALSHKHVAGMSEQTRKWVTCVWGRTAGDNEDFDINIPYFPEMGELAG